MENKAVFTSRQVIELKMPILYIVHDSEDDWQFLSGLEEGENDGRLVSLGEIYKLDETMKDLSWLVPGTEAKRESIDSEWDVFVSDE